MHLFKSFALSLPIVGALIAHPASAQTDLETYFKASSAGMQDDNITPKEQRLLTEWMEMHDNQYTAVKAQPFYTLSNTMWSKDVKFWDDSGMVREVSFVLWSDGETFAPYFTEVKDCKITEEPQTSIIKVDGQRIRVAEICEQFGPSQTKLAKVIVTPEGQEFVLGQFQAGALVFVELGMFDTVPFATHGTADALKYLREPAL